MEDRCILGPRVALGEERRRKWELSLPGCGSPARVGGGPCSFPTSDTSLGLGKET